jgi:DNA-binding FrmR family transcriptional regulator
VNTLTDQHTQTHGPGYADRRTDHLHRLHKVEGQIRGIAAMVEQDRYCIDVLTQVSAATKALHEVAVSLLDDHVRHCVLDAARSGDAEASEKIAELSRTMRQALRL